LGEYRKKRHFDVTSEPKGSAVRAAGKQKKLAFVIQKHRATALHYDFRLEWKGVMLSWAVPKGPSVDPSVKRMAMQVEDHPIEYNAFEGVIPAGEYGGGTVMIWDKGHWLPESPDVDAALAQGQLKLTLQGTKLHGSWVLVRTRGRPGQARAAWLLIKHRDEWAKGGGSKNDEDDKEDVTEREPRSAVSQRLLVEIARDEGGDMRKAADGDPPALLERMLKELPKPSPKQKSKQGHPPKTRPAPAGGTSRSKSAAPRSRTSPRSAVPPAAARKKSRRATKS